MANPVKQTRGRQRVAMQRMEKESNRWVTYSKRSQGLLKKASELCTLCGVHTLCVIFSPANKPCAFGHPSVEAIMNRFLLEDNNLPRDNRIYTEPLQDESLLRSNMELTFLKDQIENEKKRANEILEQRKLMSEEALQFLSPPETSTYAELKQIDATLTMLENNVLMHGHNLKAQANNSNQNQNQNQNPGLGLSTLDGLNPNQNQNPAPAVLLTLDSQNQTTPTFGDQTQMAMPPPPPLVLTDTNTNILMGMNRAPMTAFNIPTHPNIPQAFQGPTNLNPGSFDAQNSMLADMGWNPMPRQNFTNLLMGEGSSNSQAFPGNPQSGYMGNKPILGDYQTFQNMLMVDDNLNSLPPLSNPQAGYMGTNPIPGDYRTFRNLMGEGSSNPSDPPHPPFNNPQGGFGFGFGSGFDPGMN